MMQESVGATSARACRWLLKVYRRLNLKARPMTCLYDSVVTLCPLEERFVVSRLHQLCMSDMNTWDYEDDRGKRVLKYTIDNDFNWRWSTKASDEDLELLDNVDFCPTPERLQFLSGYESLRLFVS